MKFLLKMDTKTININIISWINDKRLRNKVNNQQIGFLSGF